MIPRGSGDPLTPLARQAAVAERSTSPPRSDGTRWRGEVSLRAPGTFASSAMAQKQRDCLSRTGGSGEHVVGRRAMRPESAPSGHPVHAGNPAVRNLRFDDRPLLVFWEMTKACGLACAHCRACAQPDPGSDELTTAEGRALIEELASMGRPRPILILTGGDCLKRSDIVELVAHARDCGVPVAIAPSVTPELNLSILESLKELGVTTASLSLDGSSGATHDRIRGIEGHFDATLTAIELLKRAGYKVQVNTTVMAANLEELPEVAALLKERAVDIWEVFFLITTGRGTQVAGTTPEENEAVCHFLVDASRYGFTVRTVEAPFFRRVAAERKAGGDPRWMARARPLPPAPPESGAPPRPSHGAGPRAERSDP